MSEGEPRLVVPEEAVLAGDEIEVAVVVVDTGRCERAEAGRPRHSGGAVEGSYFVKTTWRNFPVPGSRVAW